VVINIPTIILLKLGGIFLSTMIWKKINRTITGVIASITSIKTSKGKLKSIKLLL